jgi:FKBP-type peptidyl-prolyl cis-trans isomerase SlyD
VSDTPTTVQDGVVVLFEYTLSGPDGAVIETVAGDGPIPYLHGAGNIVSGLEARMVGHVVGDSFKVEVPAAEAYGDHDGEDPEKVERADLPEEIEEGMPILAELEDGTEVGLWVVAVEDDHALLSQNHPLAGVDLTFDIDIKGMRAATAEEIEHGHPHGVDGHESH